MGIKFITTEEYYKSLPVATRKVVKELRKIIKYNAPKVEEVISYNIPAFKLNGKILIWFAGWKEHVSLYPLSQKMQDSINGLEKYKASKGTIKFPLDKPLPIGLIKKIIRYKVKENIDIKI